MFVVFELVEIEWEKRAHAAEAVTEDEPDPAKGGGGGSHAGPNSNITF